MCKRMNIDARCDKSPVRPIPSQPSRTHYDQPVPFTHNASTHAHKTKRHRIAHAPRPFQKTNRKSTQCLASTTYKHDPNAPKSRKIFISSTLRYFLRAKSFVKTSNTVSFRFVAFVDSGVGRMTVGEGCEEDVSVDEERACTVAGSR